MLHSICLKRKKISLSTVFAGQKVGIKEVGDGIWSVAFMDYDLGFFDLDSCRVEPGKNPFGCSVLTMSPESTLDLVVGREGFEPSTNGLRVRCSTN